MNRYVDALLFIVLLSFLMVNCAKKSNSPISPEGFNNSTNTVTEIPSSTNTYTPTDTSTLILPTDTFTATPTETNTPTSTPIIPVPTVVAGLSFTSLVSVPGGTFTQRDQIASFSHTISNYMIGQYEVTYELWYTVHQWAIVNGYTFENPGREPGVTYFPGDPPSSARYKPVVQMSWRDMIVWCNAYSEVTGRNPAYCSDAAFTTAIKDSVNGPYVGGLNNTLGSFDKPYVNWSANGYRLPTEGEWNYAASYVDGSSWTPYNYASGAAADYNDTPATELVAWINSNGNNSKYEVGSKLPNALGIYDMSGNAWESVYDYTGVYPGTSTDYRGPSGSATHIRRGGSTNEGTFDATLGQRNNFFPYNDNGGIGFRVARTF